MGGQIILERLTSIHTIIGALYHPQKRTTTKNEKKAKDQKKRRTGLLGGNPPSGMGAHIQYYKIEQVEVGCKLVVLYCC